MDLADQDESVFAGLLGALAPEPDDLVVLFNSYFDESYDAGLLCVAGYSFTSAKARALDAEWRVMLARYHLPYFRMSACNACQEPFDHLTEQQCIAVATEAIGLIHKFAAHGYAVTVDQEAFNKVVTPKGFVSTPYELCAWQCLIAARSETAKITAGGKTSYFFEAGFRHEGLANRLMNNIFKTPTLREAYNYKSHTFVDKVESRPTQAADLLAWQWYKDSTRRAKGATKSRGDLVALLSGTPHWVIHSNAERLRVMIDMLNTKAGTPIGNEIAGAAMKSASAPIFWRGASRGSEKS